MDWSLCIATMNRRAALLRTLTHALTQTRPPREVVVIDVSDDWKETAQIARDQIFARYPEIELTYRTSPVRSSATQRNFGLSLCTSEIVFMIDDDSFMFPDCAEEVMRLYEADRANEVACIGISMVLPIPDLPDWAGRAEDRSLERKASGNRSWLAQLARRMRYSKPGRWINRKILMQNVGEIFLLYEGPRDAPVPASLTGMAVTSTTFMGGCAMTVRREVAMAEPFDPALRYYAAFEDLDATYRYGRHGVTLRAAKAQLHHFEASGGRMKRKKVIIFQLLNMILFLKRHAARPETWKSRYRLLLWRRLLAEFLKDALSGRFDFPQVSGVLVVMRQWGSLWRKDVAEFDNWYPEFQKSILDDL